MAAKLPGFDGSVGTAAQPEPNWASCIADADGLAAVSDPEPVFEPDEVPVLLQAAIEIATRPAAAAAERRVLRFEYTGVSSLGVFRPWAGRSGRLPRT
jgi:hypothetical protein